MTSKSMTVLLLALTGLLSGVPDHATCQNARIVSTRFPQGTHSYIYSPGVEVGEATSSISADFEASFWALGAGHPAFQLGVDSGAFAALGPERDGWVRHPVGSPAYFHTTWAAGKNVDDCIDTEDIKTTCTVVLMSDQVQGRGYFALLSATPLRGNYSFVQPENGPIVLAPIPTPLLIDTAVTSSDLRATVRVDALAAGLYLDSGCPADIVRGYRIYAQVVKQGGDVPTDRERPTSSTGGDWVLADGGETLDGGPLDLGTTAQVTIACEPNDDVYLAASVVFDSGFETRHLSDNTAPIRCSD